MCDDITYIKQKMMSVYLFINFFFILTFVCYWAFCLKFIPVWLGLLLQVLVHCRLTRIFFMIRWGSTMLSEHINEQGYYWRKFFEEWMAQGGKHGHRWVQFVEYIDISNKDHRDGWRKALLLRDVAFEVVKSNKMWPHQGIPLVEGSGPVLRTPHLYSKCSKTNSEPPS